MKSKDEILNDLIKGGVIGASLGAIISKKNKTKETATLGAIAGAAIFATYKANQNARNSNIPVLIGDGDAIYEVMPNGDRKFVKAINKSKKTVSRKFKI